MFTNSVSNIRCSLPMAPFHQLLIYMVSKKQPGKAEQSTMANGGNEHAQLAIKQEQ